LASFTELTHERTPVSGFLQFFTSANSKAIRDAFTVVVVVREQSSAELRAGSEASFVCDWSKKFGAK
jgi:hypothetical protein